MKFKDFLIIALIGVIIFLLIQDGNKLDNSVVRKIDEVFLNQEDSIKTNIAVIEKQITVEKEKIKGLTNQQELQEVDLSVAEELKDTSLIVERQKVLISTLKAKNTTYEVLINRLDSTNLQKDSLLKIKDYRIDLRDKELNRLNKKEERRKKFMKIGAFIAGIGLLTLLIVK